MPLVIALWESFNQQKTAKYNVQPSHRSKKDLDDWGMPTTYERASLNPPVRLFCSFILAIAVTLKRWAILTPPSTTICSDSLSSRIASLFLPAVTLGLDSYIMLKFEFIIRNRVEDGRPKVPPGNIIALAFTVSQIKHRKPSELTICSLLLGSWLFLVD